MLIAFDRKYRGRVIKLIQAFRITIAAKEQQGGVRCLICCHFSFDHAEVSWFKSADRRDRQLRIARSASCAEPPLSTGDRSWDLYCGFGSTLCRPVFVHLHPTCIGYGNKQELIQTDYVQLFLTDLWLGAGKKTANILVVAGPDPVGQHQHCNGNRCWQLQHKACNATGHCGNKRRQ